MGGTVPREHSVLWLSSFPTSARIFLVSVTVIHLLLSIVMFLYIPLIAFVILDAAESLSTRQDLFDLTDFSEPMNLDPSRTDDSLFLPDIDDSAAGDSASFYSSISGTSNLGPEEDIFASSNPVDLSDEGDAVMAKTPPPPPCEGNSIDPASLIQRSMDFDQPPSELADSSGSYCVPSSKINPPVLDLPNNLDDLYDQLNPKPAPLLDPFLKTIPYRVFCPLNGDYSLLCCAVGSGTKKIKCSLCKSSARIHT